VLARRFTKKTKSSLLLEIFGYVTLLILLTQEMRMSLSRQTISVVVVSLSLTPQAFSVVVVSLAGREKTSKLRLGEALSDMCVCAPEASQRVTRV